MKRTLSSQLRWTVGSIGGRDASGVGHQKAIVSGGDGRRGYSMAGQLTVILILSEGTLRAGAMQTSCPSSPHVTRP